jgi:hypothetical protein
MSELQICESPIQNLNEIYGLNYGIYGRVHLIPYINDALLWTRVTENQNLLATFS